MSHGVFSDISRAFKSMQCCVQPYYIRRPDLWNMMTHRIDRRIAVCPEWKFVYVRIPKAANTTCTTTLAHTFPIKTKPGTDEAETQAKKIYNRLRWLSRAQMHEMLNDYFIFTVVRNPYHRTLSAYLDKLKSGVEYGEKYVARAKPYDNGELTFRGFCRYLKNGGAHHNCHWMPQTTLVNTIGLDRLDYIGKVENLDHDMQVIVNRIAGREQDVTIRTSGPTPTRASEKCKAHYDEECVQIIRDVFKDDFKNFEYSDDSPI